MHNQKGKEIFIKYKYKTNNKAELMHDISYKKKLSKDLLYIYLVTINSTAVTIL